MSDLTTVADRLAAARVRVRPLVWSWNDDIGCYHAVDESGTSWMADDEDQVESVNEEHAAAVLANLEVVPSEEVKP